MDDFVDLWGQMPQAYNKKKLQDKFYEWHSSGWRVSELRRQFDNRLDKLAKDNSLCNAKKSEHKADLTYWSNLLQRELEIMHANFWDIDFEIRSPLERNKPFARMLGVEFPPSYSTVICPSTKNCPQAISDQVTSKSSSCQEKKLAISNHHNGLSDNTTIGSHCVTDTTKTSLSSSENGNHSSKKKRLFDLQQQLNGLYKTEESIRQARDAILSEKPIDYERRWEKWEQLWRVQDKRSKLWRECETISLSFLKD